MRTILLMTLALLALNTYPAMSANTDAIKDLITGDSTTAALSAQLLANESPDSVADWIRNFNDFPAPDTTGWAVEIKHKINDTLTAPAWLYIPTSYDPHQPTPFVVSLHGGVSGPKFRDASSKNWHDEPVIQLAEEHGWLVLYPLGMTGCAWWDKTGMANILWFVREVKRLYNVDDDRVAMCGFSDGASGSFHFDMLAPTDFAVFFPWSGSPPVGTLVTGIQTYLSNLGARPLFASNGGNDQLYPAEGLVDIYNQALIAGSDISVAFYDTAGHNYGYMPAEWLQMAHRFETHPRDAFPPKLYYETADLTYSSRDWLRIESLDTTLAAPDWYVDYNDTLSDDRLTIGFNPDMEYKGKGVKLGYVSDDSESPATKAGMKPGDILTKIDNVKIEGMEDVAKAKLGRIRGDPIKLTFKRGSKKFEVETSYPPSNEYPAFPRVSKSGAVKARRIANMIDVHLMRVTGFSLLLSPEIVNFNEPVKVKVIDGYGVETMTEFNAKSSSETILKHFLLDRDRKRLIWDSITIHP